MSIQIPQITDKEIAANRLAFEIRERTYAYAMPPALKDLRKDAVNLGLTLASFDRALAVLGEQGRMRVLHHGGVTFVVLTGTRVSVF